MGQQLYLKFNLLSFFTIFVQITNKMTKKNVFGNMVVKYN